MSEFFPRQVFFLHIPKTGGLSLRAYLNRFFAKPEICPPNSLRNLLKYSDEELARFRFIRGHLPYNIVTLLPAVPVRITFLRDPFERTLSNYAYLKTRPDISLYRQATSLSLAEYLQDPRVSHNQTDMMTYYLSAWFPVRGRRERHRNLRLALARLDDFEFVGITERYAESLELLAHTFGLPPARTMPRRNVSENRRPLDDLTPAERAQIDAMTRLDQQVYAHARALFEARYNAMLAQRAASEPTAQHP